MRVNQNALQVGLKKASRQGREEQEQKLNDFLMAHSLPPDGSLSHRLKVNPVELEARLGLAAKNASKGKWKSTAGVLLPFGLIDGDKCFVLAEHLFCH